VDKCPKCQEYSLDYDIFEGKAICTHNGCGFSKRMSEDKYIIFYADFTKYVVIPIHLQNKIDLTKKLKK
jgi:hypothetical protein